MVFVTGEILLRTQKSIGLRIVYMLIKQVKKKHQKKFEKPKTSEKSLSHQNLNSNSKRRLERTIFNGFRRITIIHVMYMLRLKTIIGIFKFSRLLYETQFNFIQFTFFIYSILD
jgi:hypothetical protein